MPRAAALKTPVAGRPAQSAESWRRAALDWIAAHGIAALAIEPLARHLGVTKGSFYWHFRDRRDLLGSALAMWEAHDEAQLAAYADTAEPAAERLERFFRATSRQSLTHQVYAALLAEQSDSECLVILKRVTQRRFAFLRAAYRALGFKPTAAEHQARLTYSAYAGLLQLQKQGIAAPLAGAALDDYVEHLIRVLLRKVALR